MLEGTFSNVEAENLIASEYEDCSKTIATISNLAIGYQMKKDSDHVSSN